jgi:hypothetical protein
MSVGIKVRLNRTAKIYDVYAIIRKKSEKEKIYLIKGLSGATRINFLTRTDEYLLLELAPGIDPEEPISNDYKWIYENELTILQPESNDKATSFLFKESW